jgi:splicing factor 3A subunit 1
VIDRTALFVARSANPPLFEDKIREGQRSDPKFSFLNPLDPYHGYYRHRMDRISMGDLGEEFPVEKGGKDADTENAPSRGPVDVGQEPPLLEFAMDMPNISSIDLCVLALLSRLFLPYSELITVTS